MAEKNDYVNRELSWIEFNYRVLSEARDKSTPLFDRLKFLSITASNLDEFYMVRVASLKDMVHAKYAKKDIAGLTAKEQLEKQIAVLEAKIRKEKQPRKKFEMVQKLNTMKGEQEREK